VRRRERPEAVDGDGHGRRQRHDWHRYASEYAASAGRGGRRAVARLGQVAEALAGHHEERAERRDDQEAPRQRDVDRDAGGRGPQDVAARDGRKLDDRDDAQRERVARRQRGVCADHAGERRPQREAERRADGHERSGPPQSAVPAATVR
jgi:hypothetical protein